MSFARQRLFVLILTEYVLIQNHVRFAQSFDESIHLFRATLDFLFEVIHVQVDANCSDKAIVFRYIGIVVHLNFRAPIFSS